MTKLNQIYRCAICGNIIDVLHPGVGELVCCGQPMELLVAKDQDVGFEKHVPIVEKTENGVRVSIGSVPHPMEESHYIEWVEIIADNKIYREFLKPGDQPVVNFIVNANDIQSRVYCNIHGLWQSKQNL